MQFIRRLTLLLFAALVASQVSAAVEVGEVSFSRGVLTGQIEGELPKIIGKGEALHNGETLNTGSRGLAVIKLDDGTRMTLRPNTTFKIENVNLRQGQENAFMRLIRGGLRAITGTISKRNANAFKIGTSVATIGIRGTEFDARLCEAEECDAENKSGDNEASPQSPVIARIAVLKGNASAQDSQQFSRVLAVGAAVYEGDQLQTGINSFAVVAFNDDTRVTMSPNSVFRIEEHEYKPEIADENNALLSFIRGGLRLVTGAIGRLNRKAFRVATPTATIGIRGTGFDLICEGRCVSENASLNPSRDTRLSKLLSLFIKPVYALGDGNGMYARVWDGEIELQLQNGNVILPTGRAAYLVNNVTRPLMIPEIPIQLRNMGGAPRPDRVKLLEDLFGGLDSGDIKPGLYVNVRQGDVEVLGKNGSVINLGGGEAGVAGLDGATLRFKIIPPFQKFDPIPDPRQFTARMENLINLIGLEKTDRQEFECSVR